MCFFNSSPPPPPTPPPPPPIPNPPMRADEENKNAVEDQIAFARRRRGRAGTVMTGGLGDPGFGTSIARGSSVGVGTTLG